MCFGSSQPAANPGCRHEPRAGRRVVAAAGKSPRATSASSDPYRVLGVEPGATKAEVRAAYLESMKSLHPDVNPSPDATQVATCLNMAYEEVLDRMGTSRVSVDEELGDVFDRTNGPVSCLFCNPFSCYGVDPLMWQELQQVVQAHAEDPQPALMVAGVSAPDSSFVYLTEEQMEAVRVELEAMQQSWAFELTAYYLADCLARARLANNRTEVQRWRQQ